MSIYPVRKIDNAAIKITGIDLNGEASNASYINYTSGIHKIRYMINNIRLEEPMEKYKIKDVFEAIDKFEYLPMTICLGRFNERLKDEPCDRHTLVIINAFMGMAKQICADVPEEQYIKRWLCLNWVDKLTEELYSISYHNLGLMRYDGIKDMVDKLAKVRNTFFTGDSDDDKEGFIEYVEACCLDRSDAKVILLMIEYELNQCKTEESKKKYNIYDIIDERLHSMYDDLAKTLDVTTKDIHLGIYGAIHVYDD